MISANIISNISFCCFSNLFNHFGKLVPVECVFWSLLCCLNLEKKYLQTWVLQVSNFRKTQIVVQIITINTHQMVLMFVIFVCVCLEVPVGALSVCCVCTCVCVCMCVISNQSTWKMHVICVTPPVNLTLNILMYIPHSKVVLGLRYWGSKSPGLQLKRYH